MAYTDDVVGRPRNLRDWAGMRSRSVPPDDPVTRSRVVFSWLVLIPTVACLLVVDLLLMLVLELEQGRSLSGWNNLVMVVAAHVCVALALASFTAARRWSLWVIVALGLLIGGGGWLVHEFLVPADQYFLESEPYKPWSLRVPVALIMLGTLASALLAPAVAEAARPQR